MNHSRRYTPVRCKKTLHGARRAQSKGGGVTKSARKFKPPLGSGRPWDPKGWVVLTRALTRNAILNTVSANESLVSAIVSEASVSDALLTNERCH